MLLSYYLSIKKPLFLLAATLFLVFEWAFDCLDGTIGRQRNEGYVRWGFFMDHLFDFFFMTAVVFGISFHFPLQSQDFFMFYILLASFMVVFFLAHTQKEKSQDGFDISFMGISPIEFRLATIAFNISFYVFPTILANAVSAYLMYLNTVILMALIFVIYSIQKKISDEDVPPIHGREL